jgi:hypothetical protein
MTADLNPSLTSRASRIERLCQALAVVAALWAIVSAVVWFRRPTPLELAERVVAEGQLPLAVECYLAHLVRHPQDWRARLELAAVLDGIDPPQSLVELRKIPANAEQYREALRFIARICLSRGRDRDAKEALLALEAGAPDDRWVHSECGDYGDQHPQRSGRGAAGHRVRAGFDHRPFGTQRVLRARRRGLHRQRLCAQTVSAARNLAASEIVSTCGILRLPSAETPSAGNPARRHRDPFRWSRVCPTPSP